MQDISVKEEEKEKRKEKKRKRRKEGRKEGRTTKWAGQPLGSPCAPPLHIHHHPDASSAVTLLPASLALSFSELSFRLHPCPVSCFPLCPSPDVPPPLTTSPLPFTYLTVLRPQTNHHQVSFLIERLASRDGRNQANSSGIEQKAESSGWQHVCKATG
jgi:hypothetical protein